MYLPKLKQSCLPFTFVFLPSFPFYTIRHAKLNCSQIFFFNHSLNVLIIPISYSQNTADLFSLSLAAKYLNSFIYSCITYSLLDKLNKGQTFTSSVSLSKIQAQDLTFTNHIHMPYFEQKAIDTKQELQGILSRVNDYWNKTLSSGQQRPQLPGNETVPEVLAIQAAEKAIYLRRLVPLHHQGHCFWLHGL